MASPFGCLRDRRDAIPAQISQSRYRLEEWLWNSWRGELFDPLVASHRGRIVKMMGDGALVEFASAVDAVRCAIAIQNAMAERNVGESGGKAIAFRIGVTSATSSSMAMTFSVTA
jgi:hypothetical protein